MQLFKLGTQKKEILKISFILFLVCTIITSFTFCAYLYMDRSAFYDGIPFFIWGYYIISALGYAAILSAILVSIFFAIPSLVLNKIKVPLTVYTTIVVIFQILLIINSFIITLYRQHININQIIMTFTAGDKLFVFDNSTIAYVVILNVLFALLPYIVTSIFAKRLSLFVSRKSVSYIVIVLVVFNIVHYVGFYYGSINRGRTDLADEIMHAESKLPYYQRFTNNDFLSEKRIENFDEANQIIFSQKSIRDGLKMKYPLKPILKNDSITPYNIIYIALDSWNYATYNQDNTPHIYDFGTNKGQYYAKHSASAACTPDGNFNLFFGLPAEYYAIARNQDVSPVFIDRLIEQDYNISVLVSAGFEWPALDKEIFSRVKDIEKNISGKTEFERDTQMTQMAVDFIDKQNDKDPFFMYIFYDLLHAMAIPAEYRTRYTPSLASPPYSTLNNSTDPTPFFNLYKNCLYYLDSLVNNVINEVERKGLLDKTIIVITADHGQEFNENKKNYWGHASNYTPWQTQVPLIFYYPGIEAGKVHSYQTAHFDITPTIMQRFMGVENPMEEYSIGVNLEDSVTSRYPLLFDGYLHKDQGGFEFEDIIVFCNYQGGYTAVTDKSDNKVPRSKINIESLKKGVEKLGRFYTKD